MAMDSNPASVTREPSGLGPCLLLKNNPETLYFPWDEKQTLPLDGRAGSTVLKEETDRKSAGAIFENGTCYKYLTSI